LLPGELDPIGPEFIEVLHEGDPAPCNENNVRNVRIVPASFGKYHSVMGAAAAFLWESFNHL